MRVRMDNGRIDVHIEVKNGYESFLSIVFKALKALNYSEADIIRYIEKKDD